MIREIKIAAIMFDTDKNYSPYYNVLPSLIRERNYKKGIEIGVFAGGHVKAILDTTEVELVVGVDPYEMYKKGMPGLEDQKDWDCLCALSNDRLDPERYVHLRMSSDEAIHNPIFQNKTFDFVFIDVLHTYDQLKSDLVNYSSLIRKGGVIACHDYKHPNFRHLTTAINEFARRHRTKVIECPLHAIYMEWK